MALHGLLFPPDNSRWTALQLVHLDGQTNEVALATTTVAHGEQALRVLAKASNATPSNAAIEKGGFVVPEGSTVLLTASPYIATEGDIENLLLLDLECCSCWDPRVPDNQCPGIRLMVKGDGCLSIERGKILGETICQ